MRAYIAVVFAFFSCSSSPYALVYCIPAQTMAQTASSAQREIATVAILIMRCFTPTLSLASKFGPTPMVQAQQVDRNWSAVRGSSFKIMHVLGIANTFINVNKDMSQIMYFISF
jgi:hypothetical protein